jgi:hypothetical protein
VGEPEAAVAEAEAEVAEAAAEVAEAAAVVAEAAAAEEAAAEAAGDAAALMPDRRCRPRPAALRPSLPAQLGRHRPNPLVPHSKSRASDSPATAPSD